MRSSSSGSHLVLIPDPPGHRRGTEPSPRSTGVTFASGKTEPSEQPQPAQQQQSHRQQPMCEKEQSCLPNESEERRGRSRSAQTWRWRWCGGPPWRARPAPTRPGQRRKEARAGRKEGRKGGGEETRGTLLACSSLSLPLLLPSAFCGAAPRDRPTDSSCWRWRWRRRARRKAGKNQPGFSRISYALKTI